jgi:hypothetical protein
MGLLYVSELHFLNPSVISPLNFDIQCTVLLIKKGTLFLKKNWYFAIEFVRFLAIYAFLLLLQRKV